MFLVVALLPPTPDFVSGLFKVLTNQDELGAVIKGHLGDCEQANFTKADGDALLAYE